MAQMALQANDSGLVGVLYMALELSKSTWKVGFEYQGKRRIKNVTGGEVGELRQALDEAMQKLGVPAEALVRCCYEAGRDGFWLHRLLEDWGVENVVVDPASIEVSRQARRTKTDRPAGPGPVQVFPGRSDPRHCRSFYPIFLPCYTPPLISRTNTRSIISRFFSNR